MGMLTRLCQPDTLHYFKGHILSFISFVVFVDYLFCLTREYLDLNFLARAYTRNAYKTLTSSSSKVKHNI